MQQEGILFICFLISVHVVGCWEKREINVTISRSMQDVTVILYKHIFSLGQNLVVFEPNKILLALL